jgi:hypothetical protein
MEAFSWQMSDGCNDFRNRTHVLACYVVLDDMAGGKEQRSMKQHNFVFGIEEEDGGRWGGRWKVEEVIFIRT